ncbi:hypothetical protein C8R45DRAFT_1098693 [Mycena sanguinolenta]|nr:hypothetical protein C8R45DRAFT_1098693 [Mycena sanguinolenta]
MLDGFSALPVDDPLIELYDALWPTQSLPTMPPSPRKVPQGRLVGQVKIFDGSRAGLDDGVDNGLEDDKPPPPPMYYLDISTESVLRVFALEEDGKTPNTLLVRDDYLEFLADVDRDRGNPPKLVRYFLTGQPGIGKSFGSCYFLFHCFALGQPLFFLQNGTITYFGPNGCEVPMDPALIAQNSRRPMLAQVIKESWVIIDVDADSTLDATHVD